MSTNPAAAPARDYSFIIETGKDGVLSEELPRKHVEGVFQRAIASGKPIVLHLHGGLVDKTSALKMVDVLQPEYLAAGYFPIFIVWRTGLFDAVKNANELVERPLFKKLLVRLLKFLVSRYGGIGGKALGPGEEPDDAQIEAELDKRQVQQVPYEGIVPQPGQPDLTQAEKDELASAVQADAELREEWESELAAPQPVPGGKGLQLDESVRAEAAEELAAAEHAQGKALISGALLAKHAVLIAGRVIKRFFKHRDHGLHTTIVEEILRELFVDQIGTEIWQFMKQDSADTFANADKIPERGGWLLMRLLGEAVKQRHDAGESLPVVSIVGHSAGSIYAGNLLTQLHAARTTPGSVWHNLPFQFDKLVFLAPAVTCKVLNEVLKKHSAAPLFRAFRMYSLTDEDERGYYEIPVLYPGSLLYIISGLLEDDSDAPVAGMQRYARTQNPFSEEAVIDVWTFLRSKPNQLVWSGDTGGPGLNCDSTRHGDFDNTPKTIASFLYFLK